MKIWGSSTNNFKLNINASADIPQSSGSAKFTQKLESFNPKLDLTFRCSETQEKRSNPSYGDDFQPKKKHQANHKQINMLDKYSANPASTAHKTLPKNNETCFDDLTLKDPNFPVDFENLKMTIAHGSEMELNKNESRNLFSYGGPKLFDNDYYFSSAVQDNYWLNFGKTRLDDQMSFLKPCENFGLNSDFYSGINTLQMPPVNLNPSFLQLQLALLGATPDFSNYLTTCQVLKVLAPFEEKSKTFKNPPNNSFYNHQTLESSCLNKETKIISIPSTPNENNEDSPEENQKKSLSLPRSSRLTLGSGFISFQNASLLDKETSNRSHKALKITELKPNRDGSQSGSPSSSCLQINFVTKIAENNSPNSALKFRRQNKPIFKIDRKTPAHKSLSACIQLQTPEGSNKENENKEEKDMSNSELRIETKHADVPPFEIMKTQLGKRRFPKLMWNPDEVEHTILQSYLEKIKDIVGELTIINEEKALRALKSCEFDIDRLTDNIKKQIIFYRHYLQVDSRKLRRQIIA